jgi:hypothetical protein
MTAFTVSLFQPVRYVTYAHPKERRVTDYMRIFPRDFFNESKLLKCMGQLTLQMEKGFGAELGLKWVHDRQASEGFEIRQDGPLNGFYCDNVTLYSTKLDKEFFIYSVCNARTPYPLFHFNEETGDDVEILDDLGNISGIFMDYIQGEAREYKRKKDEHGNYTDQPSRRVR